MIKAFSFCSSRFTLIYSPQTSVQLYQTNANSNFFSVSFDFFSCAHSLISSKQKHFDSEINDWTS